MGLGVRRDSGRGRFKPGGPAAPAGVFSLSLLVIGAFERPPEAPRSAKYKRPVMASRIFRGRFRRHKRTALTAVSQAVAAVVNRRTTAPLKVALTISNAAPIAIKPTSTRTHEL
jgi:hypothetical protein